MIPTVCIEDGCTEPVWTGSRCPLHRSRRVRPPGRPRGPGWASIRRQVLQAAGADERGIGGQCALCGRPGTGVNPLQAGHIVPSARGGSDDLSNLRAEHKRENERAGRMLGGRVAHAKWKRSR